MLFMPPGSAKSTYGSVRGPAYYLGRKPHNNIISASYGENLATSFGRKVRNLVGSREYMLLFPGSALTEDSRAKGEWETQAGGSYFAAGVGSSITGRRGDLGVIDDPVKGRKESDSQLIRDNTWDWYKSDFLTRLKPNAAQIIIQTRWHEDDLSGRLLPEKWNGESGSILCKDGQYWEVVCLPAQAMDDDILGRKPGEWLWLDWFDEKFWEETRQAQAGEDIRNWNSLYQQTPRPDEGTYFKRAWFKRYVLGSQPRRLSRYAAGDFAVTEGGGDYSEIGVGGFDIKEDLYLIDWWTGQTESDVWVEKILSMSNEHQVNAFIAEKGQIEKSVGPFLRKEMRQANYVRTESISHGNKDKPTNCRSFQALASQGKVYIPLCEWGDQLIEQLISFPVGKNDDKADVCGLFGKLLDKTYGPRNVEPDEPEKRDGYGDFEDDEDEESWATA